MDFKDRRWTSPGIAQGFGVTAERVDTAAGFDAALEKALTTPAPVLLEVIVEGSVK